MEGLLKKCDAKDGVADNLISDPLGCDFDPAELACKAGQRESCLTPEKVTAIKKAMGGPKTERGMQVYPGFLYDTGITASGGIRGILLPGPGLFGPTTTATDVDVEKEAAAGAQPAGANRAGVGLCVREPLQCGRRVHPAVAAQARRAVRHGLARDCPGGRLPAP